MASKRKSSKPTRIAKEDVVVYTDEGDGLPASADEDDTMSKIQRFIEEGSEDTPDCLQRKLEQSPTSKPTNRHEDVPQEFIPKMGNSEIGERMFPDIFSNGHIPSNLKFHQLLNDEVDSIKKVSEDIPTSMQETVNGQNGDYYFTVVKAQKTTDTDESDEHLTFKQVSGGHRKTSKRSKPCDDETPRYACSVCKYVTNRSDHHKRHLMTHSADKPLKCPKCSYGTGRSDHYKRHLQRHGLSEHEIINTCFRNGLKLKSASIPTVTPDNDNPANVPKENLEKNAPSLKATPPAAATTAATFPRANDKKFKCDQCSYSTDKSSHLTRHRNSHAKSALSRCRKCNKSYRASPNYHKCAKTPGHRCPKCAATFEERAAMLRHILDRHGSDDALVSATKPVLRNMAEAGNTTKTIVSVVDDGDSAPPLTADDPGPIDLSVAPKHDSQGCDSVSDAKSNLGDRISRKGPGKGGNMGCTKCGVWFDKYNEYTTHACVS